MQLHREISTIRDSSLKVRCEKLISGAEKQLRQAATAIRTVKHNCLCMARNSVDTFKAKGKAALRRAAFAMKMDFQQYVLVGSTVRSYLAWLKDTGRLTALFEDGWMRWARV